jgi:hypothetical protein
MSPIPSSGQVVANPDITLGPAGCIRTEVDTPRTET